MTDREPNAVGQPKERNRWLRIALLVSVALNLAVVGVVAGVTFKGAEMRRHPAARDLGFGPFSRALTEDDRRAMADAFRSKGQDLREMRRRIRSDMIETLALLRAETYDPAALRAAFDRGTARIGARMKVGQELLLERISTMSRPERLAFADRLEQSLARKRWHGGKAGDADRVGE